MSTVSIIAVGTEITSGEILNRNSQWLGSELEALGFNVVLHISVADDRQRILDAFEVASQRSEVMVITGGLGPTSDDFTREVVAQFAEDSLIFREEVYAQLQKLYEGRGLPLRDAHKQQCYFPTRAQLLENPVGTALGFFVEKAKKKMFVLPGPPREVEGVFEKAMKTVLEKFKPQIRERLVKWKILGVPESEVAEKVEPLVQAWGLKVGYRASAPYVYVKIWIPVDNENLNHEVIETVSRTFSHWAVVSTVQDLADELLQNFSTFPSVRIIDEATGSKLMARFAPFLKNYKDLRLEFLTRTYSSAENNKPVDASFFIRLEKEGYRVSVDIAGQAFSQKLTLPFRIDPLSDRGQVQMCEQALWHWLESLKSETLFALKRR